MRTGVRIWVCGVLLLLLAAGRADAAPPVSQGPADQCAVMPEGPRIVGTLKKTYLSGAFHAKCKRNMREVGVYACLMEIEYPGDPGRPVECVADRMFPYFMNDTLTLTLVATCEYTTIPRFYVISGYGWGIFLPNDGGLPARSPEAKGRPFKRVLTQGGSVRYCHISAKNMRWKMPK